MTENKQENINSGYVLKEVNLLHGNDGICSKIYVSFHPFSFSFLMIFKMILNQGLQRLKKLNKR